MPCGRGGGRPGMNRKRVMQAGEPGSLADLRIPRASGLRLQLKLAELSDGQVPRVVRIAEDANRLDS